MNFLFRVDASQEIGLGHFMRCLALAQMLAERNDKIYFLMNRELDFAIEKIKTEGFSFRLLNGAQTGKSDSESTVNYAKEINADWIITDGYNYDTAYQKIIKESNYKLMCIDDIPKFHYLSDIILNQNLFAEKNFKYSGEDYTRNYLGIKYLLYRREFRQIKGYKRIINDECRNILLTFGGSDPENITTRFAGILEKLSSNNLHIKILLGPGFKFLGILEESIKKSKNKIEIFKSVDDVMSFYKWCDIAVTSAGSTVWELSKLNTPMITGVVAENQEKIAEELGKQELAVSLGWFNRNSDDDILNVIKKIFLSKDLRKRLTENNGKVNFSDGINELLSALK